MSEMLGLGSSAKRNMYWILLNIFLKLMTHTTPPDLPSIWVVYTEITLASWEVQLNKERSRITLGCPA